MDTNGANVSNDADVTDCDGEKVVTMMDVLQEQQDFEDDANAVLGASDEKNCTFPKGYVKRQAIYACLTCCSEAQVDESKRAGVCLACSLNCHENHELVELYTKRNFRCDCGNPKFNSACQFTADKTDLNEENKYNQNFSGLYCVCHRPYPDPEAIEEDEMIQCIMCEDWLHSAHLEATIPQAEYSEMICKTCIDKNEFLHDYFEYAVNNIEMSENPEPSIVNVTTLSDTDLLHDSHNPSNIDKSNSDVDMAAADIHNQEKDEKNNSEKQNNAVKKEDEKSEDVSETKSIESEPNNHDTISSSKPNEDNLENNLPKDEKSNETANENIEDKNLSEPGNNCDETNSDTTLKEKEQAVNDTDKEASLEDINTNNEELPDNAETLRKPNSETPETTDHHSNTATSNGDHDSSNDNKRKLEDLEVDAVPKKIKLDDSSKNNGCCRPKTGKKSFKGASFWPSNFRQKLCTCNECISMYKDLSVLYLIDPEDTVSAYETLGQEKTNGTAATQYEKGLEALSSLGRVQQINALTEYNNMRDKLLDFLQSFKDRKEIVKEDDIKAFFAGMKAKREPDGVYFCR